MLADCPFSPSAIQLYSVRDQLNENPQACLKMLAKTGFTQAEGFDLIQLTAIKPLLDEFSIEVKSSFLLWSHVTGRYDLAEQINYPWLPPKYGIEYALEEALELQLDTVVCGYLLPEERSSLDCYKRLSDHLNIAGEKCQAAGLSLLYHNHAFEFEPLERDCVPYHYLTDNTESEFVGFEVDVLWSELAGQNSAALFALLGDRLKQLHLKTGSAVEKVIYDESLYSPEQQDFPLGHGFVNIDRIVKLASAAGVKRAYIEQEHSRDIHRSLKASLEYLKSLIPGA